MSQLLVSKDPAARLAERQNWITPKAEVAVQDTVRETLDGLGGKTLRAALHGDWLHEPLHAVMTDVPVGSWTAAMVFDSVAAISGSRAMDSAADACVGLGLLGAMGAAVTGMNDWAEVKNAAPRRIGAVHALLNIAATGFYGASLLARRKRGSRSKARALGALGFVIASASAHLGGNLVYEHGVGVEGSGWQR